jgi:hypothetical protein
VADPNDEHYAISVFNLANDSVVAHSITPETKFVFPKRFPKLRGFSDAAILRSK